MPAKLRAWTCPRCGLIRDELAHVHAVAQRLPGHRRPVRRPHPHHHPATQGDLMKLYRFLEPGDVIGGNDLRRCFDGRVRLAAPTHSDIGRIVTKMDVDREFLRLVAEVPDDANIAAALTAAEIVEAVWDGPVHGNGVRTLLDRYRAAKGGAR